MRYLAKITGLPNRDTGEMNVIIPTLSFNKIRTVYPIKVFLGLVEPYAIGDIVVVESIEGRMYYGDKPYANGEFNMGVPKDSYSFVTPYGYIAFTPTSVVIQHINGGQLILGNQAYVQADFSDLTGGDKVLKASSGNMISSPTNWR